MDAHRPCPDSALLAAFLDGMLADDERTAVVMHLADCPQCRASALTVVEFREVRALDEMWQVARQPEAEPRPVMRVAVWTRQKTRAPALAFAVLGVGITVAASLYYVSSSLPTPQPASDLIDAVGGQRLTRARLSGGVTFARPRDRSFAAPTGDARLLSAVSHVRDSYGTNYGAPARRAVGVAALLVGELNDAVASLSIASLAAPTDARIASDLAAAYYERASRAGRADDLPAAFDAAERAVQLQPDMLEAWFNQALVITALGLRSEARDAWQAYLQRDSNSPWAAEARRHERELSLRIRDEWPGILRELEQTNSPAVADNAVSRYPSRSREVFEQSLEEWTAAARSGRDTPHVRARLRALGLAFQHVQQERFYLDVSSSIDLAVTARRERPLAQAHAAWFSARELVSAAKAARARPALLRARKQLADNRSPLALRVQVEQATVSLHLRKFDAALSVLLPALKRDAVSRKYRVIAARASWITGLTQYARNDVAAARVAYEEMLELARLPADVDQFVAAHVLLANIHYVAGDNKAAWRHRVDAMPLLEECETESTQSNALLSAAGHADAAGHLSAALLFESRQLQSDRTLEPSAETQARIQRATTWTRLGRPEAARLELKRARERLAGVEDARQRARREAELLAVESELLQPSDPDAALRRAEQAVQWATRIDEPYVMSRIQLRLADAALARGYLNRADEAASEAIAQIETSRFSSLPDTAGPSDHELPVYAKAAQIALRRGDPTRAFAYMERRRLRTLFDKRQTASSVLPLQDVQQRLDADTALAVFNQIADQLYVWIITRDDVVVHSSEILASRAAALVSSQWQEIAQQTSSPKVGGELFDTLFRPVWRHLRRVKTLVVVADAPYNEIAMAGLWDGVRGKYLIEDFRLVSTPAATTFAMSQRRRPPGSRASDRLAIVSASRAESLVPSQRDLGRELSLLYGTAQSRIGASATPSEVLNQIGQRDVVHLAAAIAGTGDARASTRVLVADEPGRKYSGSLSAEQLASVKRVRAHLVTLDMTAPDGSGSNSSALQEVTQALLAAGVSTVVGRLGTLPSADLDGTWIEFHRQYAVGVAAAESLQRAQLAALEATNRRTGPWATLTVFGAN
jgi:tetratricopeptide (TPR) repeat protein